MKIVGLITEYNPFHNGHLYHIKKAKEVTGADAVITIMSGDYVQRGTPSIMPKHIRTQVALEAGADLVIELPVCYSCASAEYFARGAVSLLDHLNCVDAICFGSECGDMEALAKPARILADEPRAFQDLIRENLKSGMSFPLARQKALKSYLPDSQMNEILEQPNNILGIEYMKALYQLNSSIIPYTIKRKVSGYHDTELSENYSSASAIRRLLAYSSNAIQMEHMEPEDRPGLAEILERLEDQVPHSSIPILEDAHHVRYPVYVNDFSLLLKYKLIAETRESLMSYFDVSEDLANRIVNNLNSFITLEQFCDLLKTKHITYSRISRALLHILLDIKKDDLEAYQTCGYHNYAHLLGFRKRSSHLLTLINEKADVTMITKLGNTAALSEIGKHMLEQDIFAADLYESVITGKFKYPFISEYEQQLVVLE